MPADPVLSRLVADVDRATATATAAAAALRAYLDGVPADVGEDLVTPKAAEARYGISADTRVRWAKEEGLGVKTDEGWCLCASLVKKYRNR